MQRCGHSAYIGAGFDGVTDQHAYENCIEKPTGLIFANYGEKALAGDLTELG